MWFVEFSARTSVDETIFCSQKVEKFLSINREVLENKKENLSRFEKGKKEKNQF